MQISKKFRLVPANKADIHQTAPKEDIGRNSGILSWFNVKKRHVFFMFVVIPSLLSGIYYGLIASEQFTVEALMVVRTIGVSEQLTTTKEREGRAIIGGDSLNQDSYIVASFLESKAVVNQLEKQIGLRNYFSRKQIDYLSRLDDNATLEELHNYWLKQIEIDVDGPSGIIRYRVRGFSPEDALLISETSIEFARKTIAQMSERALNDLALSSQSELILRGTELRNALSNLRNFQNETGILDPTADATAKGILLSELIRQKVTIDVRISVLEASGVQNSASLRQLRENQKSIARTIDDIQQQLTSSTNLNAISNNLVDFAAFEIQRLVSQTLFRVAQRNLDTINSTALRQTTFLALFADPTLPTKSDYPTRLSFWFLFSMGIFCLWTTITLIWMSIEDHRA